MALRAVFLDVDGVILDPAPGDAEWMRLSGEVYAAEFGRDPVSWGRASQEHFGGVVAQLDRALTDPAEVERTVHIALLARLCAHFGLPEVDDERAFAIGRRQDARVAERLRAQFPGAAEAIRKLGGRYALHTATGHESEHVDAVLRGFGVRALFGVLAGPDLVGVGKYRPGFYEAIFALAGVAPAEAVVVDDDPDALTDAAATGAVTIHVPRAGATARPRFDAVVRSIREVPAALDTLVSARR